MVTRKKPTTTDPAPAPTAGTLACEASLNAAHTQTRLKITGAMPGGHKLFVIAMRPDGRREDIGEVGWDGERGDIVIPFVARWIRLMSDFDDPDRVEVVVDVVQDFIDDNVPPPDPEEPPADPPEEPTQEPALDGSYQ